MSIVIFHYQFITHKIYVALPVKPNEAYEQYADLTWSNFQSKVDPHFVTKLTNEDLAPYVWEQ